MGSVLVIGNGGREQALAWKLAQSPRVDTVYVAPGNGGSKEIIQNIPIDFDDVDGLLDFARRKVIGLTVVGQEAASEAGVVDAFMDAGLKIFGPTKAAVKIESSKAFSKDLMHKQSIPTAAYKNFTDPEQASSYAKSRSFPVVVKADGLATGKGVVICESDNEVDAAIDDIMVKKIFGDSGTTVVVEDFLKGNEVSMHALSDGNSSVMFPPSQDHKQAFDDDKGPNTGGMGVIAPVPWVTSNQIDFAQTQIVQPALAGLKQMDATFVGVLYPGLMIDGDDINLLEFNARFGDPEAEVYMRLLDADLYEVLLSCADGRLEPQKVKWSNDSAVSVVLASGGYPGSYEKGKLISGIDDAVAMDDIVVFHAGTAIQDDQVVTAGGRVLNVTATGDSLDAALEKAYKAVKKIHFDGMQYRSDIGRRV